MSLKIRTGFVSNSSTSSFIIKNISDELLTLKDFVKEISFIYYDYEEDLEKVLDSTNDLSFYPGDEIDVWEFGDHTKDSDPLWARQLENLYYTSIHKTKSFSWTLIRS